MFLTYLVGIIWRLTGLCVDASEATRAQLAADGAETRRAGLTFSHQDQGAYLRRFVLNSGDRQAAQVWIDQLGDPRFSRREEAKSAILKLGPATLGLLRSQLAGAGAERHKRLLSCLRALEAQTESQALESAIRWCAPHPESVCVLWDLLASYPSPGIEEEIIDALLLSRDQPATRRLIATGETSDAALQRALFHLIRALDLPPGKDRDAEWGKALRAAPHWAGLRPGPRLEMGGQARARGIVECFVAALRRGDPESITSYCQTPFLLGRFPLQSRTEITELLTQTAGGLKDQRWTCHVLEVLYWNRYEPSPEEAQLLNGIPPEELRAVHIRTAVGADPLTDAWLLVRVGPVTRLVGVGEKSR